MSDLPALLVALPLVGSVLAFLAGLARPKSGWPVALVTTAVQVVGAALLASRAFDSTVSYVVGGFDAPFGIELYIDGLSATIALLVAVVSFGVLAYSRAAGPRSNAFYAVYLLLVAGLTGMSITGDVFNMYVFLEITGLAAYALVASGEGGRSARAALKYLIVGTIGASLFLLGIGYAFIATGTLNMADLADQLAAVGYDAALVQAAFALMVVGLFVKVAVFPLHAWQPDAYAGSPDSVSALISALVSTVAAYALIRIIYTVFTVEFLQANPAARSLLVAGAVVSIVFGSVLAVSQTEIKKMLAYSSVSQFGLVVGGIAVANEQALIGATIHLVGHAIMKGGLFLTAGVIATATGARTIDGYEGLVQRFPLGAGVFGLLALSMVGVPPAVGFVGKWYIALGAVEASAWPLAVVILLSTLLTLAYFARILERMFFHEEPRSSDSSEEPRSSESTGDTSAAPTAADGGDVASPSIGMAATVVIAALAAVALGMLAFEYGQLLEPTVQALLS